MEAKRSPSLSVQKDWDIDVAAGSGKAPTIISPLLDMLKLQEDAQ